MVLLLISFVAGVLTVLAPCILPLLPVIIGGSLSNGANRGDGAGFNKKKAFTIIISLGVSVIAFTLLLKASTLFIDIPEYVWKWISGGIIIFLGLVTLFPSLWENQFIARLSTKSNILLGKGSKKNSFWGDVIVGSALGPVFSTCSPTYFIVLATVLPVRPALGVLYLLAYTIGLCLALLIVSIVGQKIMNALGVAANPKGWFKRILGIIFLIVGIAIIGGLDKKTQLFLLDAGFFDVTKIEQKLLEKNTTQTVDAKAEEVSVKKDSTPYLGVGQKQVIYKKVPELSSINGYVNTEGKPITLESLKGKVVLLDIWTYSCINCQRTIPYINEWYKKYKDQGFEVVGLHTPEFAFEKVQTNVEKAVQGFNIKYPVVLDNDYSTWNALGNQFWPRKYLIDIDGYIIYDHIGEGAYEETEKAIQNALKERALRMGMEDTVSTDIIKPSVIVTVDSSRVRSPEVYFGSSRNEYLANGKVGQVGEQTLSVPSAISFNKLYLGGTWSMTPEYAENKSAGSIVFSYESKNVYMTAGSVRGIEVEIYKDDVFIKNVMIKDETLYQLIQDSDYGKHVLRIVIPKAGLQAFTFTFG
ncbi:MAG: cytochrome C bioproteinis protein transmembrane region [Parcubacteria group bacterium Greene0714_7]|nr:MAG: cytochrome C bioproteinis protein transmembrane region [Parcubacteria group bacterium Greene0714_7]